MTNNSHYCSRFPEYPSTSPFAPLFPSNLIGRITILNTNLVMLPFPLALSAHQFPFDLKVKTKLSWLLPEDLCPPAQIPIPSRADGCILSLSPPLQAVLTFLMWAFFLPCTRVPCHVLPLFLLMRILQKSAAFEVPLPWKLYVISYFTLFPPFIHLFSCLSNSATIYWSTLS